MDNFIGIAAREQRRAVEQLEEAAEEISGVDGIMDAFFGGMDREKAKPAASTRRLRRPRAKLGHDPIQLLPIGSVRPSPENEQLYRPVDPDDDEIRALAHSVKLYGIQQPLVVTRDGWIIAGHRRYVAATLAGLTEIPCRVSSILKDQDHDKFMQLLCECNRQRVKSLDEQLREAVVEVEPDEAYRSLIDYRRQKAAEAVGQMEALDLGEVKERSEISSAKRPLVEAIKKVLESRRQFWPLSDRQIHYPLLNSPPLTHASKPHSRYRNDLASYKKLVELLTRMRIFSIIPMDCIDDETRPVTVWKVHESPHTFIREQLDGFLRGYYRDLLQSQPNHVEIVVEKNTVAKIVESVAADYCIPLTSGRGFSSLPPRAKMAERYQKSGRELLTVLIVSDYDPDGEMIAESFGRSMRDDFGISRIATIKVALTAEQVDEMVLPPALTAKETSTNYARFLAKYGSSDCYELEALEPVELQRIVRSSIEQVLDMEVFRQEVEHERQDAAFLENTRRRVAASLRGIVEAEE